MSPFNNNQIHLLAQNKMIILYFIYSIKIPIPSQQLDEFILSTNYMTFFEYQQCINELCKQSLINKFSDESRIYLEITNEGKETLLLLKSILPEITIQEIDQYVKKNFRKIKQNTEIFADYKIVNKNEFIVQCLLKEENSILFDLKVNVPNVDIAKRICKNWVKNAEDVYRTLFEKLAK